MLASSTHSSSSVFFAFWQLGFGNHGGGGCNYTPGLGFCNYAGVYEYEVNITLTLNPKPRGLDTYVLRNFQEQRKAIYNFNANSGCKQRHCAARLLRQPLSMRSVSACKCSLASLRGLHAEYAIMCHRRQFVLYKSCCVSAGLENQGRTGKPCTASELFADSGRAPAVSAIL